MGDIQMDATGGVPAEVDRVRRMNFMIVHDSGAQIAGQFTATETTGVTWSLNGNPPREVAALTVDLRTAIEALIAEYNRNGDEAARDLLNL